MVTSGLMGLGQSSLEYGRSAMKGLVALGEAADARDLTKWAKKGQQSFQDDLDIIDSHITNKYAALGMNIVGDAANALPAGIITKGGKSLKNTLKSGVSGFGLGTATSAFRDYGNPNVSKGEMINNALVSGTLWGGMNTALASKTAGKLFSKMFQRSQARHQQISQSNSVDEIAKTSQQTSKEEMLFSKELNGGEEVAPEVAGTDLIVKLENTIQDNTYSLEQLYERLDNYNIKGEFRDKVIEAYRAKNSQILSEWMGTKAKQNIISNIIKTETDLTTIHRNEVTNKHKQEFNKTLGDLGENDVPPTQDGTATTKANEDSKNLKNASQEQSVGRENNSEIKKSQIKEFDEPLGNFHGQEAVAVLLQEQKGHVKDAFFRDDIGSITLPFGKVGTGQSDGWGLSKIAKFHPEVLDKLEDIVENLPIIKETEGRIKLADDKYFASIRKEFDGTKENWVLTAFEKKGDTATSRTDLSSTSAKAPDKTTSGSDDIIPHPNEKINTKALKANKNIILHAKLYNPITDKFELKQTQGKVVKTKDGFTYAVAKDSDGGVVAIDIGVGSRLAMAKNTKELKRQIDDMSAKFGKEYLEFITNYQKVLDNAKRNNAPSKVIQEIKSEFFGIKTEYDFIKDRHGRPRVKFADFMKQRKEILGSGNYLYAKGGDNLAAGLISGVEEDEDGNLSINPAKFIAGLGGYTVAKKLLTNPKVQQELKNTIGEQIAKQKRTKDIINHIENSPRKGTNLPIVAPKDLSEAVLSYIKTNRRKVTIQRVPEYLKESLAKKFGYKHVNDIRRTINGDDINHVLKRHGNADIELSRNQEAITLKDIQEYPNFVNNADIQSLRTTKNNAPAIISGKQINGHYVIVEEVQTKQNELAFKTMYKVKGKLSENKMFRQSEASHFRVIRTATTNPLSNFNTIPNYPQKVNEQIAKLEAKADNPAYYLKKISTSKGKQKAKNRLLYEKFLNIKPIKEFGINYAEFYHNGTDATKKLLKEKKGQVVGAFHREDLGDIDLVWGNENFGLAHILSKRSKQWGEDKALRFISHLDENIKNGHVVQLENGRVGIKTPETTIVLDKKNNNKFIITAFRDKNNKKQLGELKSVQSEAYYSEDIETNAKDSSFLSQTNSNDKILPNHPQKVNEQIAKITNEAQADTLIKNTQKSIKINGGIPEDAFDLVLSPIKSIQNKLLKTLDNFGKVKTEQVKARVSKITADEFANLTGVNPHKAKDGLYALNENSPLYKHFTNKNLDEFEIITRGGKREYFRVGLRDQYKNEGIISGIKSNYFDQISDEYMKHLHLKNAYEQNSLRRISSYQETLEKAFKDNKESKAFTLALDEPGFMDKLPEHLKENAKEFRKLIDERANLLEELGMLDPNEKIEHYVKRLYEEYATAVGFKEGLTKALFGKNTFGNFNTLSGQFKRKDLSLKQREELGQIFDASRVIPATLMLQEKQIQKAKFFKDISDDFASIEPLKGYVQVPNSYEFGLLKGKYIPHQMHYSLVKAPQYLSEIDRVYQKAFSHFKVNKTVKNPGTHFLVLLKALQYHKYILASPTGFEPVASKLGILRSILLSYGDKFIGVDTYHLIDMYNPVLFWFVYFSKSVLYAIFRYLQRSSEFLFGIALFF